MRKRNLCVVIPAFNEAVVIGESLKQLKTVFNKRDIYVVSDGSSDNTAQIARNYGVNVMRLIKNVGKARAIEKITISRQLCQRYKYLMFFDADSLIDKNFYKQIRPFFKQNLACIVGRVASQRYGIVSAYRTFEYSMSQYLFKLAQDQIKSITVAPGCAAIYNTKIIPNLIFSSRTLTEDYDLTLQIQFNNMGRVKYVHGAVVHTQDPKNLKDYWKQIQRWHTGYWQNFYLHRIYLPRKAISFELLLTLFDNIAGILWIFLALIFPGIILDGLLAVYLSFVLVSTSVLVLLRKWWALVYVPYFVIFYLINVVSFMLAFVKATFQGKREYSWNKVSRYTNL